MGPKGCVVPPYLRPLCTLHDCQITNLGLDPEDSEYTKQYFDLRDELMMGVKVNCPNRLIYFEGTGSPMRAAPHRAAVIVERLTKYFAANETPCVVSGYKVKAFNKEIACSQVLTIDICRDYYDGGKRYYKYECPDCGEITDCGLPYNPWEMGLMMLRERE